MNKMIFCDFVLCFCGFFMITTLWLVSQLNKESATFLMCVGRKLWRMEKLFIIFQKINLFVTIIQKTCFKDMLLKNMKHKKNIEYDFTLVFVVIAMQINV